MKPLMWLRIIHSDVNVWHYTLLVMLAMKEEKDHHV